MRQLFFISCSPSSLPKLQLLIVSCTILSGAAWRLSDHTRYCLSSQCSFERYNFFSACLKLKHQMDQGWGLLPLGMVGRAHRSRLPWSLRVIVGKTLWDDELLGLNCLPCFLWAWFLSNTLIFRCHLSHQFSLSDVDLDGCCLAASLYTLSAFPLSSQCEVHSL